METSRKSHLYEQLPSNQYESHGYEYPRNSDSLSMQPLLPLDSITLSEDGSMTSGAFLRFSGPPTTPQVVSPNVCYQNTYRKRENPLYQSISQIDSKSSSVVSSQPCPGFFVVLTVMVIIACLFSFLSFGMVVYIYQGASSFNSTLVETLQKRLETVQQKYEILIHQVETLQKNDFPSLLMQHELLINESLTDLLEQMQNEIHRQVSIISKMPGPPGPPGVGNLTACRYSFLRAGGASAIPETVTGWIPKSTEELQTTVITGVECSTNYGAGTFLNVTTTSDGTARYQCHCHGTDQRHYTSRYCFINYWLCPRIS